MNKIFSLVASVAATFAFVFVACSAEKTAGTATDTENTIAGVVKTSTGLAARSASVKMIAAVDSFGVQTEVLETLTDSNGVFAFDSVLADSFNLLVQLEDSSEISLKQAVNAENLGKDFEISLAKPAVVSGNFDYADYLNDVTVGSSFKLSVLGAGIERSVFAGDTFSIALPAGKFKIAFIPSDEFLVQKLQELGYADSVIFQQSSVELTSGDTLHLGDVRWVMGDKPVNVWKKGSVLSGYVTDASKKPVAGASVRLITDTYGFMYALGLTSATSEHMVYTDSTGYWELPFPSRAIQDSVRVEATTADGLIAESRFVKPEELKQREGKNLSLDTLKLSEPASIDLDIHLVLRAEDFAPPVGDCLMNGVVVGIVGSSKFSHIVTCDDVVLEGLPVGKQMLVFYTSDLPVLNMLIEHKAKKESFVNFISVGLEPKKTLKQQGVTYTPPMH